jgi:hypothetical protein
MDQQNNTDPLTTSGPSSQPPLPEEYDKNAKSNLIKFLAIVGVVSTTLLISIYFLAKNPDKKASFGPTLAPSLPTMQPKTTITSGPITKVIKAVQPTVIPDILEKQAYISTQYGFRINQPKGWQVDASGKLGTLVLFFSPRTEHEGTNPFVANINVAATSNQGYNLDTYVNAAKNEIPKLLQNYALKEENTVNINGVQAKFMSGTFTLGNFHLRNLQLIILNGSMAYTITGTTLDSTWDQYKYEFKSSLSTFGFE